MTPEQLAQAFHKAYERLAPSFGYETRKESAKPWANVPAQNKALMIAVCGELQEQLTAALAASQTREQELREALDRLWKHTPKIDNGMHTLTTVNCAVCCIGRRYYDPNGSIGTPCDNARCLSHAVEAALSTPSDSSALERVKAETINAEQNS